MNKKTCDKCGKTVSYTNFSKHLRRCSGVMTDLKCICGFAKHEKWRVNRHQRTCKEFQANKRQPLSVLTNATKVHDPKQQQQQQEDHSERVLYPMGKIPMDLEANNAAECGESKVDHPKQQEDHSERVLSPMDKIQQETCDDHAVENYKTKLPQHKYNCPNCSKKFGSKCHLDVHTNSKMNIYIKKELLLHRCTCGNRFNTEDKLTLHKRRSCIENRLNRPVHQCDYCQRVFVWKRGLLGHWRATCPQFIKQLQHQPQLIKKQAPAVNCVCGKIIQYARSFLQKHKKLMLEIADPTQSIDNVPHVLRCTTELKDVNLYDMLASRCS